MMRRLGLFAFVAMLAMSFLVFNFADTAFAVIPSSPNLVSPANGGNVAGTTVSFSWNQSNGAVDYWFEMATDQYFSNIVVDGWSSESTGVTITDLDDDGTKYFWRVTAWSYDGSSTSWTWSFVNGPSAAPAVPTLVSPANGANKAGSPVLLEWSEAARANDYHLQVATDSGFVNTIVDEWVGDYIGIYLDLGDDGTTYYWRVAAKNAFGTTAFSGSRSFVNGPSAAPVVPTLVSPANGVNVAGSPVLLEWSEAARANDYHLQVATDSGFVNKIVDEWIGDYIGIYLDLGDDGTTYYWRVAAKNALGTTAFTGFRSFVNGPSAAPGNFALVYPADASNRSGTDVSFYWSQAARANDYHFQIAEDVNFNYVLFEEWVGNINGINLTGLPDNGTQFYWRVKAKNQLGETAFLTRSFLNGPSGPPETPMLKLPENGSIVPGTTIALEWFPAARAANYYIVVANDPYFSYPELEGWLGDAYIGAFVHGNEDGQRYYWKIKAKNPSGESEFSEVRSYVNDITLSCVPASGTGIGVLQTSIWGITNPLGTCYDNTRGYFLKDISRPALIRTQDYTWGLMKDPDDNWNSSDQGPGVDAHKHASMVYDYLRSPTKSWVKNSFDGNNQTMSSVAEWPCGEDNAYWNGIFVTVCNGIYSLPLSGALDVTAHEWTHAVTNYRPNGTLTYAYESGALNEAFSDWMAVAVEHYYRPGGNNWKIGEAMNFYGLPFLRDLADPKNSALRATFNGDIYDFRQPDTYKSGDFWFDYTYCTPPDNDYCGVHINNGVPNKMFYLLSQGTDGIPHNGVEVQGIGIDKAIEIAYKANMELWPTNATFHQAYDGMRRVAEDYFSSDPNIANQVRNAWAAVKVASLPRITTSSSPSGGGTTSASAGIEYPWGASATVTATPNPGYQFQYWTEYGLEVSTTAEYTFNVNGSRTLVANFVVAQAKIDVAPASNDFGVLYVGDSTPPRTLTLTNSGSETLVIGTVKVYGDNPQDFLKYYDGCSGQSLAANVSCTIQLKFTPTSNGVKSAVLSIPTNDPVTPVKDVPLTGIGEIPPTFSFAATTGTDGTITPSLATVNYGGSQTFTITPQDGYHITQVTVDGVSQGAISSYTFTNVTSDHTITASFAINTYTITTMAGSGGTITPSSATVNYGGSQTFTITPNSGYHIVDAKVDGVSQGAITSYTFANVTAGHTIEASFAINPPNITLSHPSDSFGDVWLNKSSSPHTYTVTNTGTASLTISAVTLTGQSAVDFVLSSNTCAQGTLNAGSNCTVQVKFAPKSAGTKTANLSISSNDPDTPQVSIALTGRGLFDMTPILMILID